MTAVALALAPLSLHRPPPADLVKAAAAAGYTDVGLRLALPSGVLAAECTDGGARRALRGLLDDEGVGVLEISNVELAPDFDPDSMRPLVETCVELGAKFLQVVDWDPERERAVENLGRVSELTADAGIRIGFEFMPYTSARSLDDAQALLSGLDPGHAGIVFDALHFVRSGGVVDSLQEVEAGQVAFVQLCDASAEAPPPDRLRQEAIGDRLPPGHGALPLRDIMRALGPRVPISIEAPCRGLADLPAEEQARILHSATSNFLEGLFD
ncbi:MAG: sugar phosphate isomerase/epimerase [Acidimicrobiaceae bacterium]|nr:sugar phosphate isomerase/epimerase [Acidimicrobiaceae bacterium]MBO0747948.1 sugar phosphate isomerase/epimerase [Acidimicrobiaceae bacterium]